LIACLCSFVAPEDGDRASLRNVVWFFYLKNTGTMDTVQNNDFNSNNTMSIDVNIWTVMYQQIPFIVYKFRVPLVIISIYPQYVNIESICMKTERNALETFLRLAYNEVFHSLLF
jgi:hypothetical protein